MLEFVLESIYGPQRWVAKSKKNATSIYAIEVRPDGFFELRSGPVNTPKKIFSQIVPRVFSSHYLATQEADEIERTAAADGELTWAETRFGFVKRVLDEKFFDIAVRLVARPAENRVHSCGFVDEEFAVSIGGIEIVRARRDDSRLSPEFIVPYLWRTHQPGKAPDIHNNERAAVRYAVREYLDVAGTFEELCK